MSTSTYLVIFHVRQEIMDDLEDMNLEAKGLIEFEHGVNNSGRRADLDQGDVCCVCVYPLPL